MTADLFKKDYRQMTAQGVKFTPEDIVLLNALAVKVRLSQNAARTTHLPRLAFLPKRRSFLSFIIHRSSFIVLREPTIAHEMWLEQAQRYITIDCDRTFDLLYGYALAHPAEKLPDVFDPKRLIRKVFTWCARHLAHLTREQLSAAVDYVLFGADWTAGERGPRLKVEVENGNSTGERGPRLKVEVENGNSTVNLNLQPQPSASTLNLNPQPQPPASTSTLNLNLQPQPSPTIGLLTEARALRLPITLDDAKRMTASELDEAITRCLSKDHKIDYDAERRRAIGEYVRAREAIRKRSAKAATEASPEPRKTKPSNGSSSQGEAQ